MRTGAMPALSYGATAYGTPTTTLKKIRGFACSVRGELRGRSTFARLRLENYDPAASLAIGPIIDWAKAIWDRAVPKEDLQSVWRHAHCLIAGKTAPFRHVCGPGGATLASCMRLGWKLPSPFVAIKRSGTVLDLREVCPMQIRLHAMDDLHMVEAENSSLAARIGGPPDLEALSDFLKVKRIRSSPVAGSMRALGEGGWWTQSRLHAEGRAADKWCRACGDRGGSLGPVEGTLHHRCVACIATRELREKHKDQALIAKAQSAAHGSEPLFQHGVPILKGPLPPPAHTIRACGGRQAPDDLEATGFAFTDGAMRGRAPRAARRSGWAWVVVDHSGDVIYGLHGPCPDPFPPRSGLS